MRCFVALWLVLLMCWTSPGLQAQPTLKSLSGQVKNLNAQRKYLEALPIAEQAVNLAGLSDSDLAAALSDLGDTHQYLKHFKEAESLFSRALTLREKAGAEHPDVARSLSDLAYLYEEQGLFGKAEPLYLRALVIREKALGPDHPDTATGLNNLATFYESKGDYARAEPLYVRALAIREKALGPDHPDTSISLKWLVHLYESQDVSRIPLDNLKERIRWSEQALALFRGAHYRVGEELALQRLGRAHKALGHCDGALDYAKSCKMGFSLAAQKHHRELRDLGFRRQHKLKLGPVLSSDEVASILDESFPGGTTIIFFSHNGDRLSIWLIDAQGIRAFAQVAVSSRRLAAAIDNLRVSLGVGSMPAPSPQRGVGRVLVGDRAMINREQALRELTVLLFPSPIADRLTYVSHLIVVPALGIGTVPFSLLTPTGQGKPLVEQMSVSIAPSLHDVAQELKLDWGDRLRSKPALVVGNPLFSTVGSWPLPPLPGAEAEATAVAKIWGTRPLIGAQATKLRVVESAKSAGLLYFATHGVSSAGEALDASFLVFTPSQQDDGRWTAREIQALELHAELSVLSACQTGLGKTHEAGMIGLARAFQLAGVPRVVMSLWSVDDLATAELMTLFVNNLASEVPAEALRHAMFDLKQKRPDPAEWASFSLFGTPR